MSAAAHAALCAERDEARVQAAAADLHAALVDELVRAARADADAARAEAAAARAEAAAARADAEDAKRLAAALSPLTLGGAGGGADAAGPGAARTVPATLAHELEALASPSVAERSFLEGRFVALIDAPASVAPSDAAAAAAFASLAKSCGGARGMMEERQCYAHALAHLPAFAERVKGDISASTLFSAAALRTAAWSFAAKCKPELHVRSCVGGAGEPAFRPAFNGELKTAGDGRALEQAAYYTAMDMVRVYFPAASADEPCARRFFTAPPLGFALVGLPHVAYFISLEWVGKLLVAPVSAPFFLGSAAHAAAAAALPDVRYDAPALLPSLAWLTPSDAAARERTAWCCAGGVFRKLVRGDARSGAGFAAMHRAYARLAEVLPAAPPRLHLVRYARLAYGAHEVLVEMPAVAGREATDAEVTSEGPVLAAAAAAVAWLAQQGVVYTDLRGPNVLIDDAGAPWLVDFDDFLAVGKSVGTLSGYMEHLAASPGADNANTFACRLDGGFLPAVTRALAAAFDANA